MFHTYFFPNLSVHCVKCEGRIDNRLKKLKQDGGINIEGQWVPLVETIEGFCVDLDEKELTVVASGDIRKLIYAALAEVNIVSKPRRFSHRFLGFLGTSAGMALLLASLITGGMAVTWLIATVSVVLTLALGKESYREAWNALKLRSLTMDSLLAVSTITILAVSVASLAIPWLPAMFDAGLLIFGFRHVGLAIESSLKQKMALTVSYQNRLPTTVEVITTEGPQQKLLENVVPGDILLVQPGDIIPVDGFCEEIERFIYNKITKGAILPASFVKEQPLLSGMRLSEDALPMKMRASLLASESHLARLDSGLSRARWQRSKRPLPETAAARVLKYFIPAVFLASLLSLAIVSYFFTFALAIQCAVSVLVSACPCTLGLLSSWVQKAEMHNALAHKVRFKRPKVLEEAGHIDRVVFDLNGTLTEGAPVVCAAFVTEEELGYVAALEQALQQQLALKKKSPHPFAKAIMAYVESKGLLSRAPLVVTDLDITYHAGLSGCIQGVTYTLGNEDMMEKKLGILRPLTPRPLSLKAGEHVVYFARNKEILGYLKLVDPLRSDAITVIHALRNLEKEIFLCTGADLETAERYSKSLGILPSHIRAGCESKAKEIEALQQDGRRVAMIGDAENDGEAFVASDFGIAVQSLGADASAEEQAGAVVEGDTLLPVVNAFIIAKETAKNIKQNLALSLGYNMTTMLLSSGLLLAVGMTLNPAVGAFLMALQASIVWLNVYRIKHKTWSREDSSNKLSLTSSYAHLNDYMPKFARTKSAFHGLEENFSFPSPLLTRAKVEDDTKDRERAMLPMSFTG